MFVILLTAQESGRVILGMLIDSRGKVCLRVPRSKANAPSADSSSQRRELHVKSRKKSDKTIEAGSFLKSGDHTGPRVISRVEKKKKKLHSAVVGFLPKCPGRI